MSDYVNYAEGFNDNKSPELNKPVLIGVCAFVAICLIVFIASSIMGASAPKGDSSTSSTPSGEVASESSFASGMVLESTGTEIEFDITTTNYWFADSTHIELDGDKLNPHPRKGDVLLIKNLNTIDSTAQPVEIFHVDAIGPSSQFANEEGQPISIYGTFVR